MGMCDCCCGCAPRWSVSTMGCIRAASRSLLVVALLSLLVPSPSEAGAPFRLDSIPKGKPMKSSGGKRVVSTATNSPIYYINKVDLPSLLFHLLPGSGTTVPKKQRPRPDSNRVSGSVHKPFQKLPLPFVSNAKPIGSYQLRPASVARPSSTPPPSPSQSKVVRLKTKFVSNGRPSAVYIFKSASRRYSLQDILRRPPLSDRNAPWRKGAAVESRW